MNMKRALLRLIFAGCNLDYYNEAAQTGTCHVDNENTISELLVSVPAKGVPRHLFDEKAPKSYRLCLWELLVAL